MSQNLRDKESIFLLGLYGPGCQAFLFFLFCSDPMLSPALATLRITNPNPQ
jgi:hypothetical protein